MKTVYVITEVRDYEYGCTQIESIWASHEAAKAHLEELGGQQSFMMWSGVMVDKYDIETWEVRE